MEQIDLDNISDAPLSPIKKTEDVENALDQYEDNDSKLIALAQIIK